MQLARAAKEDAEDVEEETMSTEQKQARAADLAAQVRGACGGQAWVDRMGQDSGEWRNEWGSPVRYA